MPKPIETLEDFWALFPEDFFSTKAEKASFLEKFLQIGRSTAFRWLEEGQLSKNDLAHLQSLGEILNVFLSTSSFLIAKGLEESDLNALLKQSPPST